MLDASSRGCTDRVVLVAASAAMREVDAAVTSLSASRAPVLVTGEVGAGKAAVARALHERSNRATGPFVRLDCAAGLRRPLEGGPPSVAALEDELLGRAPPESRAPAVGALRRAHGGTLFIEAVDALPLAVQPRLLRFLETGEALALEDGTSRAVDARVVASTHRDLARWVDEGRFRLDLYYRLNVVPLRVPPLRERREDVVPLARAFLRRAAGGAAIVVLSGDACAALEAYDWPGNAAELRAVVGAALDVAAESGTAARAPAVLEWSHLGPAFARTQRERSRLCR